MELELRGRRAFVTGGSAGIGLAIAKSLSAEGVAVAVCARAQGPLDAAVGELRAAGGTAVGLVADVTDPQQLASAVEGATDALGGLDLLIANAGGAVGGGGLLDSTPEDWAATYALNVLHAAHAVRAAVPHLARSDAASVVLISSISGNRPGSRSSYATAKAAETFLAAVLAQELAEHGIRVNAVSPGSTLFDGGGWDQYRDRNPDAFAAFAHDEFPAHRLLHIEEVADAVCFLLSPRASGINGAEIVVDGGQNRPGPGRFWPAFRAVPE
jgi:3-oxoacyl-[acyl-carrier protein] reductase